MTDEVFNGKPSWQGIGRDFAIAPFIGSDQPPGVGHGFDEFLDRVKLIGT